MMLEVEMAARERRRVKRMIEIVTTGDGRHGDKSADVVMVSMKVVMMVAVVLVVVAVLMVLTDANVWDIESSE